MRPSPTDPDAAESSPPEPEEAPARVAGPSDLRLVLLAGSVLVALLLAGRLFPGSDGWLLVRIAAATTAVLVLPGVLVLRLLDGCLPRGVRLGAATAWSLLLVFAAQAFSFAVHGSLVTTGVALVVLETAALAVTWRRHRWGTPAPVAQWRATGVRPLLRDSWSLLATVSAGMVLGGYIWWARLPITGDALEHLARTRKLAELSSFDRVGVTEFFVDAGLHPGYAFPLWHTAMALVARLAGVDPAVVIQLAPAVITPMALVMVFGMGVALFGSRAAGFCTAVGQAALFGLAASGVGAFAIITGPATISLVALAPALLAVVFAFLDSGRRTDLLTVGAASLVLTVSHPTYSAYVVMLLVAFCAARFLLRTGTVTDVRRALRAVAAATAAAGLYLAWLAPIIANQPSVGPQRAEVDRQLRVYANQLDRYGDLYAMAPEAITRTGPACVIALVGVAAALLGARRRWGAFVLAGSGVVLLVCMVPLLFTTFSDMVSISQARRLVSFLPAALAFAGVAMLAARLRLVAVALAALLGFVVEARYHGDFTYSMSQGGGPAWPAWLAVAAVAVAALVLPWLRNRPGASVEVGREGWAAAVAVALVLPVAVFGLGEVEPNDQGRDRLTSGLLRELRTVVPVGSVVFSDDPVAYQAVAFAAVYVNTAEGGHVWDRRVERHDDAARFFTPGTGETVRLQLLGKYDADYVLTTPRQADRNELDRILTSVYEDRRFVLFEVPPR